MRWGNSKRIIKINFWALKAPSKPDPVVENQVKTTRRYSKPELAFENPNGFSGLKIHGVLEKPSKEAMLPIE